MPSLRDFYKLYLSIRSFIYLLCAAAPMVREPLTGVRFSFYPVGPGNQTQVVRFGGRHLYQFNHLARFLI